MLEQRSFLWDEWVTRLYKTLNEIEAYKELAPPEWITHMPTGLRAEELKNDDLLLRHLSRMHVEIGHGFNVLTAGIRFGEVCRKVVDVLHSQGGEGIELRPGERELLLERIRGPLSLCQSVKERFEEMGRRHSGHQNQVRVSRVGFEPSAVRTSPMAVLTDVITTLTRPSEQIRNNFAQEESKSSREISEFSLAVARDSANDSRTMKTIGLLGLLFLPATFLSVSPAMHMLRGLCVWC